MCLFMAPEIFYIRCNWYEKLLLQNGTSYLLTVCWADFWYLCHGHEVSAGSLLVAIAVELCWPRIGV